jgi:hypothetical protein
MTKHTWNVHDKNTHQWAWFSLETDKGVYEVLPMLDSFVGNQHFYMFEVTLKGKMIAITQPFPLDKIKAGRRAGQLLAQQHLEGKV